MLDSDEQYVPTLVRALDFRDLFLLFVGSVIGSGIFLTPGLVLQQVGSSVGVFLMAWLLGGLLSLMGALTYAELAAANPEAGGLYCYIRDGFGPLLAFLYGWCLFLVIASGSVAAVARAFSRFLAEVIPLTSTGSKIVSVLVIGVLTVINVWGTRKSANLQNWTTLTKVVIMVILSGLLLIFGRHWVDLRRAIGPAQHDFSDLSNLGFAMITVLWAYEGWQFATYSAGEVLRPQRNFPRAFLAGSVILVGLYMLAVVSYLVSLGPVAAAGNEGIATSSATVVLGSWAGRIVVLTLLLSTFSAANSTVLTASRVFYAMAKDKLFFRKLAEVHPRFQTPAVAVIALGLWSAMLACAGDFAELIGGVIFIAWIFYGLGALSIFPMRRRISIEKLPYRVPGYPWTPILFVIAAAAIVSNAVYLALHDPDRFVPLKIALVIFVLGLPTYYLWRGKARTS